MQGYLSWSPLSVAPQTKNKSTFQILRVCFCFDYIIILKPWYCQSLRTEQWIMKLHEIEREILSCRRSRGCGPVTSVSCLARTGNTGISHRDCSVRSPLQKLWDPLTESAGHYDQTPPLWRELFKLDDWWLIWFRFFILWGGDCRYPSSRPSRWKSPGQVESFIWRGEFYIINDSWLTRYL